MKTLRENLVQTSKQLNIAMYELDTAQQERDLALTVLKKYGILRERMITIDKDLVCQEDEIFTRHGGKTGSSKETLMSCQGKCLSNPACGYVAYWADNGCRHWAKTCTKIPSHNSPVLYMKKSPELKKLAESTGNQAMQLPPPTFSTNVIAPPNQPMKPVVRVKIDVMSPGLVPIVVICFNRANYLRRTLSSLKRYVGNLRTKYPVFVSRQGNHPGVGQVLEEFSDLVTAVNSYQYVDTGQRKKGFEAPTWTSYYKISQHYASALRWIFDTQALPRVVVLEDDLEISPDAMAYFSALSSIYDTDTTVFCVSGWNDNGMKTVVKDNTKLLRTDIFPGLGWMLNKRVYNELIVKWPLAFWDDWMRENSQRKGRSSIVPEVNRVYTFGDMGNSVDKGFWSRFLLPIKLNDQPVDFSKLDIKYIRMPAYAQTLAREIRDAREISQAHILSTMYGDTRAIKYANEQQYRQIANVMGIHPDFKNGDPRASFGHVNIVYVNGMKTFVVDIKVWGRIMARDSMWYKLQM